MLSTLHWQDHAVILLYLTCMLALGGYLALRQFRATNKQIDNEYFLAGRRMPWFAVGMSVIASLLSSLTYLSEPGEVWNSGITHIFGKMLAIPFEVVIVWLFCIPFMMRFRFTSAYEYLEHRFGPTARLLGVVLFIAMVVLWMGFVVLASSRALSTVTGLHLFVVIATVGVVATIYTMIGGLRAVIWTDVVQVVLLIGGGLFTIGYVATTTGTFLPDWYGAAVEHLNQQDNTHAVPFFSVNPLVRATVVTVAINMCVWHVCTHTANQMTVQRYYSTSNMRSARRSFLTGTIFGVGLNMMLVVVGLALLFFYFGQDIPLDQNLNPGEKQDRDLIFPTFAVNRLPAGLGGGILAALLAAAMSSIDSGINSIATVVTQELQRWKKSSTPAGKTSNAERRRRVITAMIITLLAGAFITYAASLLSLLPKDFGIVDAMPRTFNAITGPLGGLFLIGMFVRWARERVAVVATMLGLLTSIVIGYFGQIVGQLLHWGFMSQSTLSSYGLMDVNGNIRSLSFTWVMPAAIGVTLLSAAIMGSFDRSKQRDLAGLTWYTRHEKSPLTEQTEP